MPKPDTRMDDKRRAVAKKALEERGRRTAGELSDDPEEANVQVTQAEADAENPPYQQYPTTDMTPEQIAEMEAEVTRTDAPIPWWNVMERDRQYWLQIRKAFDEEGAQLAEIIPLLEQQRDLLQEKVDRLKEEREASPGREKE